MSAPGSPEHMGSAGAAAALARHGRTFDFASRLLDRETAAACARLYAFCRYVDDVADKGDAEALALERLDAIDRALVTGADADPVTGDFLALADSYGMSLQPARDLLAGVRSDLGGQRIADLGELHRYCYRVAGTVGLLMCGLLGVQDERAMPFAVDLGMAMQLVNIARDVREDAESGRRYLPSTWIGDLDPQVLVAPNPRIRERVAAGVERLLNEAELFFASGIAGLTYLPRRYRPAMQVAAEAYREIGVEIRRRGLAVWQGRVYVPGWRKLLIAARCLAGQAPWSARPIRPRHDQALHHALRDLHSGLRWDESTGRA